MTLALRARRDDSYLERVGKLVPIEVNALAALALALLGLRAWHCWSAIIAVSGAVLAPVILYWDAARSAAAVPVAQYVLRALGFLAWALVLDARLASFLRIDPPLAAAIVLLLPMVGERLITIFNLTCSKPQET
jgi:hypothetical protein